MSRRVSAYAAGRFALPCRVGPMKCKARFQ